MNYPHPKCDEAYYYYCTKGGAQEPECITENKTRMKTGIELITEERQRELEGSFMRKLIEKGYSTRMFDPARQDDIGGGCGQLWFVQDWMKKILN